MKPQTLLVIGGVALVLFLFYNQQTVSAQQRKALGLTPKVNRPGILGGNGADTTMNGIGNFVGGLLGKLLNNNTANGKSSGGSGSGGGSGGGLAGGPGQNAGKTNNQQQANPNANFGSYIGLDGTLYNRDGQALDENGNVVPGVFDNTGTGPAGAGINYGSFTTDANGNSVFDASAPGSIATNPLEFNDPSSPMFGVVVPIGLYGEGSAFSVPTQPEGGSTADIQALVAASQAQGTPGSGPMGDLPSSTPEGLNAGNFWTPPVQTSALMSPSDEFFGADGSGTANSQVSGDESDSATVAANTSSSDNGSFPGDFGFGGDNFLAPNADYSIINSDTGQQIAFDNGSGGDVFNGADYESFMSDV